jgi:hypothetical protein
MENDILNIAVSGDEKNKNEIVYNNVVDAMDKLKMSKNDQIDYLKQKLTTLETEYQNNMIIMVTIMLSLILIGIGVYLLVTDDYILGVSFVFIGFCITVYKLIKTLIVDRKIRNKKFVELESIRNSLNDILK